MTKSNLLFIPASGAGHLTSMLEFATRLLSVSAVTNTDTDTDTDNELSITVLLITHSSRPFSPTSISYIQSIQNSQPNLNFHYLPELDLPENTDGIEDLVSLHFQLYKPELDSFISSSSVPVTAIIVDFFATSLFDVSSKYAIPAYVYFTSTALMLSLILYLPNIELEIEGEFGDYNGDVVVPGTVSVPARSMPTPWMERKKMTYKWFLYHGKRFREAKGIVVNTVREVESDVLAALEEGRFMEEGLTPKVYPVGPVLSLGDVKGGECVDWLDKQPKGSVVFLCFGSHGSFSPDQVKYPTV